MRYKEDWEQAKQNYINYWARENHNRPLISVTAPKEGYSEPKVKVPDNIYDRWMSIDYVIQSARQTFESTYYGGEAVPTLNPNLGPDIFAAFLGCDIQFGEDTSWAVHNLSSWENHPGFKLDPENKWWIKIKELTQAVVDDARGDYLVGITDLHPGADGLVALRGPENLCMDLMDNPEAVKKANFELLKIYKEVFDELYNMTTKDQLGTTNWMGIWNPRKWYVSSCDFICMISKGMFEEFILEELLEEIDFLDDSIFHLDGPDALKHLDRLLEIPKLRGVQWVYGAGQPSASHWIPELKKIQDAGKLIQVNILPEELDILMRNLRPEGVMFCTSCQTEKEARALIKQAEDFYK